MGANTEMSRLDSLPTETLNRLLNMEGLPSVTSSSNGKVLTVESGKWKAANPAVELPAVTASDNGKVLMVVNGAWAVASLPTEDSVPQGSE